MKIIVYCIGEKPLPYYSKTPYDPDPTVVASDDVKHTDAELLEAFPKTSPIRIYYTPPELAATRDADDDDTHCMQPIYRVMVDEDDILVRPDDFREVYIQRSSHYLILSSTCGDVQNDFNFSRKECYYHDGLSDLSWQQQSCSHLAVLANRYIAYERQWNDRAEMLKMRLAGITYDPNRPAISARFALNLIADELDFIHSASTTNYYGDYFAMLCVAMETFQTRDNIDLIDEESRGRLALHQAKVAAYTVLSNYANSVFFSSFFRTTHWGRCHNAMKSIMTSRTLDTINLILDTQKSGCNDNFHPYAKVLDRCMP